MMGLIHSTCQWGKERYNSWIISKASFFQYTDAPISHIETKLLKDSGRLAVLRTDGFCAQGRIVQSLSITLADIPLSRSRPLSAGSRSEDVCGSMQSTVFTQTGLKHFLMESGDSNAIHRTAPAVVPGLWILQRMYALYRPKGRSARIDIRFARPVYTEHPLLLCLSEDSVTGFCDSRLCFILKIKYQYRRNDDEFKI